MKIRRAKIILAGFVLFLVVLVTLADSGRGHWLFALAGTIPAGDKVGHFVLFGTLSFLVNLIGQAQTVRLAGRQVLKGSAVVLALVTMEEASQVFFRARTCDLVDLASDALGIWVFGRLAAVYLKRRPLQTARVTVR
jgi:VanZ family protein